MKIDICTKMCKYIQAMNKKAQVEDLIRQAYSSLKEGDTDSAQSSLKEALETDFDHPEVLYALKCLTWWFQKLQRLDEFDDPYEKGEYILSLYKSYNAFLERMGNTALPKESTDSCQYALKRFVFSRALECFRPLLGDGTSQQDPGLLLRAGRCCKGAGEWEEALGYL